jgi:hypothetical protein
VTFAKNKPATTAALALAAVNKLGVAFWIKAAHDEVFWELLISKRCLDLDRHCFPGPDAHPFGRID